MRASVTFACAFVALLAAVAGGQAQPRGVVVAQPRGVVELFTSPNCSACPPADELFVELAHEPGLITLVLPVDSLGRSDGATSAFNERQAGYADVRHRDYSYTPQAMINGTLEAEGSDRSEIGAAVAKTADLLSVPVKAAIAGNEIVVSVGAGKAGTSPAMITVLPFVASRTVAIRRERINYANMAGGIARIGSWSGQPVRQRLPLQEYAPYDGIVVLLQAGTPQRPGAILGAARLPLHARDTGPAPRADRAHAATLAQRP